MKEGKNGPTVTTDETAADLEPDLERRYSLGVASEKTDIGVKPKAPRTAEAKDPVAVAVGQRIREIRKKQGKTQDDIMAASGLARRHVSRVESGADNPTLRAITRIADALSVSLAHIFKGVQGYGEPIESRKYERDDE